MGTISLQIPVSGALNVTEDPKISADFTTLQTLLNGNVDHSNISPTAGILGSQLSPTAGILASQLAGGIAASQLAGGILASQLAGGITTAQLSAGAGILASQLAGGITTSQLAGGVARMTGVAASANVTAADGQLILASGVGQTVTLPPVAGGATLAVMSVSAGTAVTVAPQGGVNLNFVGQLGAGGSMVLGPGAAAIFYSDGGSWFVVSGQRDTGWNPLTLINGWTNLGGAYPLAARLIGDRVLMRGVVTGGAGAVATLPAQFRPASNVQADGGTTLTTAGALTGIGFDSFSYSVS